MQSRKPLLERAFELARCGRVSTVAQIDRALHLEGYGTSLYKALRCGNSSETSSGLRLQGPARFSCTTDTRTTRNLIPNATAVPSKLPTAS